MIFLVVLYHSGVVYESSGLLGSFWIVDDPATNDLAGFVNVVIDLFAMPAIFFVSGFLAPLSIARTSGPLFLLLEKAGMRPRKLPLGPAIGVALVIGVAYSYALSVMGRTGWTKTILYDFPERAAARVLPRLRDRCALLRPRGVRVGTGTQARLHRGVRARLDSHWMRTSSCS